MRRLPRLADGTTPIWLLFAFLLAAATTVSGQGVSAGPGDPFIQRHDRDASTNPFRYAFTISFADDRRAFHPGETIKLTFRFYLWLGAIYRANEYCLEFGGSQAVFDRTDGLTLPHQPLTAGYGWIYCGFAGGVRAVVVEDVAGSKLQSLSEPMETFPAYLNAVARFDKPGHYRFYATSHAGTDADPPFASNILEFDILPRDDTWERRTLADAVRALDADPSAPDAVAALRFLGTEASVAEIARRFDDLPRSRRWDWRLALSAAPDRRRTIELMTAEIDRADRSMSDDFIDAAAGLIADARTNDSADRFRAALETLSARRLTALSKANVLAAELRQSFERAAAHEWGLTSTTARRGWKFFPEAVERALHTFSPPEQKAILQRGWRQFSDPAFVPMLQRIVDTSTAADGPQDTALRELYEADPRRGRAAILREVAKAHPATTIYGTGVLPDVELPRFDDVLANAIEQAATAIEYRRALERVERYASRGIAARVQQVYARWTELHDCESAPVALAYFFRVDPEFARAEASRVGDRIYNGPNCDTGVLFAAAKRRMTPSLEIAAINALHDPRAYFQADAVRALGAFGSARAEQPLWEAFERWHLRWRDSERRWPELPNHRVAWDELIGDDFAEALMNSVAWRLDPDRVGRAGALCLTRRCEEVTHPESDGAELEIYATPRRSLDEGPAFGVSSRLGLSRASLMTFVETFPKGTRFTWRAFEPDWDPDELLKAFAGIEAMLEARGMTLEVAPR